MKEQIKSSKKFELASKKLGDDLDKLPAYAYNKAVRVFDRRRLAIVGHDITDLISSQVLSISVLHQEWHIYIYAITIQELFPLL